MIPIFLKSKREVLSYEILYELAALSGFSIVEDKVERENDKCYIKTMYHPVDLLGDKGKVVLWFLERPSISGGMSLLSEELRRYKESGIDELWVSDRYLSDAFKGLVKFVPIGSHEGLARTSDHKIYDIADMSYKYGRRGFIDLLNCTKAPCVYDSRRSEILSHAKFLLNVHQFDDQCCEPLRFALAVAAGIPIISETCLDPYPYEAPGLMQMPYHQIPQFVLDVTRQGYAQYTKIGMDQRDRILRDFNFQDNVLRVVRRC